MPGTASDAVVGAAATDALGDVNCNSGEAGRDPRTEVGAVPPGSESDPADTNPGSAADITRATRTPIAALIRGCEGASGRKKATLESSKQGPPEQTLGGWSTPLRLSPGRV